MRVRLTRHAGELVSTAEFLFKHEVAQPQLQSLWQSRGQRLWMQACLKVLHIWPSLLGLGLFVRSWCHGRPSSYAFESAKEERLGCLSSFQPLAFQRENKNVPKFYSFSLSKGQNEDKVGVKLAIEGEATSHKNSDAFPASCNNKNDKEEERPYVDL